MNEEVVVVQSDQIDELLQNQQETNDLLTQLVQYNLEKQAAEKQAAEKQAAQDKKEQEEQLKEQQKQQEQEEQTRAEEQQQEETQATTLQEVHDMVDLNNHIMSGQILFLGIIVGLLLMKIFFDRWRA